ncbi:hypothetical protein GCM10023259_062690 [Thermocatellispora tengchongensis]
MPLAVGTATAAALLLAGRPVTLSAFVWPVFGLLGGALIRRYWEPRTHRRLRLAEIERQAARAQAVLAGRNSVAAGADTVVDVLTRTWPLLAAPGEPAGAPLAAWRRRMAEETAGQAAYLRTALLRWEERHNSAGPDLSRDVAFGPIADGTLLLSARQVAALYARLDSLGLTGHVPVRAVRSAPPGLEQELRVGPHRVLLPADPRPAAPAFDLGAPILAIAAPGTLAHSWPQMDGVPLAATVPLAGLALVLAWFAHLRIARRGPAAHGTVLAVALAHGGLVSFVATAEFEHLYSGGLPRIPSLHFLLWCGPLTAMYLRDLAPLARVAAAAYLAAVPITAVALFQPVPVGWEGLSALVWPLAFTVGASGVRDSLERDGAALAQALAREHDAAVADGFRTGRAEVLGLVERAAQEAAERLRTRRDVIVPAFLPEIERRLALVHERMAALKQTAPNQPAPPKASTS